MTETQIHIQNIFERAAEAEAVCRRFFPDRTEKALRFRKREDRLRSFAAGLLLKNVLGLEEKDLTVGEYGKPEAPSCSKCFNLSHSGSWTVLAVSSVPVGTDIETVDRRYPDIASHVLTREETDWLQENPDPEGFFVLWTLKESLSKAVGKGLSLSFQSVNVLPMLQAQPVTVENHQYFGSVQKFEDCQLAVCTEGKVHPKIICSSGLRPV